MGNVVSSLASYFFNSFIDWLEKQLLALSAFGISFINNYVLSFFENDVIDAFMNFSTWINIFVFCISLLVVIVDIAEEKASDKPVYWSVVFTNVAKSFAFANFARWIAVLSMELSNKITSYFGISLNGSNFQNDISELTRIILSLSPIGQTISVNKTIINIIFLLAVLIAVIYFAFSSLKRFGTMFVHIFTSALYIPDVTRGDTTKMGEWFRQMSAIVLTYVFIYILFFIGAGFFSDQNIIPCLACWLAMPMVSKILNKYGWSSGTQGSFGAIAAQVGMVAIR